MHPHKKPRPSRHACSWWVECRAWRWHAALLRLGNLLVSVLQIAWLLPHGMLATSSMLFSRNERRAFLVYHIVKGSVFHWVRHSGLTGRMHWDLKCALMGY